MAKWTPRRRRPVYRLCIVGASELAKRSFETTIVVRTSRPSELGKPGGREISPERRALVPFFFLSGSFVSEEGRTLRSERADDSITSSSVLFSGSGGSS